jgi:MFS family permease
MTGHHTSGINPSGKRPVLSESVVDRPCADCLDDSVAAERRHLPLPRHRAFWVLAFLFAAIMVGTTLPTPLYVIYQGQMHFSSGILTVIFAAYAAGVLAALLLAGRSSDQVGRRPVLAAALILSALSTATFILATNVGLLLVGRILSGLSAGLMTGTGTAALTEMLGASGRRRASLVATTVNMGGLGLGPLVAGLFAQYRPNPTVLVFEVYLVVLAAAGLGLLLIPETVSPRRGLTLRFAGLGIPQRGRREFLAAGVAGFAAFSLLGLFTALAPTFLEGVLHQHSHAVGGTVVFLLFAADTAAQILLFRFASRPVVLFGLGLFPAGLGLIVAALSQASMALFLTGTIVAGIALGAVFMGSLATANRLAPPDRRGQVVSTYFVFCYIGTIIPVIGVGIASQYIGNFRAVLACSILLAILCVFSLTSISTGR